MQKLNKKGMQLNQLASVVLTIVIVTVLVAIGLRITGGTRDAVKMSDTQTIGNWTTTSTFNSNISIGLPHNDLISLDHVCNASTSGEGDGTCIASGNLTYNLALGTLWFDDVAMDGEYINISYTIYTKTLAYNASLDMQGGITEIASWGTLIGLAIAATIILTIILGAFAFQRT